MKLVTFYNKPNKVMHGRVAHLHKDQNGVETLTADVIEVNNYERKVKFDFDGKPYERKVKHISTWVDGFTFMGKTWEADAWKVEFNW